MIRTRWTTVDGPGGPVEAYLARPDDDAGHPGVLFVMDAIGLRPATSALIEEIASWGYVVLAPNVFHRAATVAQTVPHGDLLDDDYRRDYLAGVMMPNIHRLMAEPDALDADLLHYVAALRTVPGVAPGPVGATGYCMGARLSIRVSCLDPSVAAVGGFHGGKLVTDGPENPIRDLDRSEAEFVFGHADEDPSMTPENIEALAEALRRAGLTARNEVYPGAGHGYTMRDLPVFDATATARHDRELRDLFARRLG